MHLQQRTVVIYAKQFMIGYSYGILSPSNISWLHICVALSRSYPA